MSVDLERLVGRAILDRDFRGKLVTEPEAAIKDSGLMISAEEMVNVKRRLQEFKAKVDSQQIDRQFLGDQAVGWN